MAAHKSSRLAAKRTRIKRIWSEVDYANRRMFYIRTREDLMQDGSKSTDSRARVARRAPAPAH